MTDTRAVFSTGWKKSLDVVRNEVLNIEDESVIGPVFASERNYRITCYVVYAH